MFWGLTRLAVDKASPAQVMGSGWLCRRNLVWIKLIDPFVDPLIDPLMDPLMDSLMDSLMESLMDPFMDPLMDFLILLLPS